MKQETYNEAASLQDVIRDAQRQLDDANGCVTEITNVNPIKCDITIKVCDRDFYFRVSPAATQCILTYVRVYHETRLSEAQKNFDEL